MKDPLALSSDEEGPNHLNSWRWNHANRLSGWRHLGGVSYPLTPQTLRQAGLRRHQGFPSTPDCERGFHRVQPQRRLERLPRPYPNAWTIYTHIRNRLRPTVRPWPHSTCPSMDAAHGGEQSPLRTHGAETDVRRVQYHRLGPQEPSAHGLQRPVPFHAKERVHWLHHKVHHGYHQKSIQELRPHISVGHGGERWKTPSVIPCLGADWEPHREAQQVRGLFHCSWRASIGDATSPCRIRTGGHYSLVPRILQVLEEPGRQILNILSGTLHWGTVRHQREATSLTTGQLRSQQPGGYRGRLCQPRSGEGRRQGGIY